MNNNILNIFSQLISGGNNPQAILQNLFMQNPQCQFIFNQIKSNGLSQKDYVLHYAKTNNINIQPMIEMLEKKGIKL